MEERKKIKNYFEFLNLINKSTKKITLQINRKLAKKNDDKIIYNTNINDILFNVYKSLNLESCSFNDNSDNFKSVKEIYSNYLYLKNNYKFQNQRVLSNSKDLFKSLYKLFKNSYEFTENQFKNYFYLFVEQFNNLFILIDIKIFGNQLKTQLILEKIPGLIKKTQEIYNESLRKMGDSLSELNEKNNNIYNNDNDLYKKEESINLNMGEFSGKINDYLKSFNEEINLINEEYRQIINSKEIKEKINMNLITIKFSEKHIDKNTDYYQKYEGINPLNLFIGIGNLIKKSEKIEQNIKSYKKEIKSLIKQSCISFKNIITNDKDLMLRKLEDTLRANETEFNGLKDNRNQYEKIKNDYFSIIKENNI